MRSDDAWLIAGLAFCAFDHPWYGAACLVTGLWMLILGWMGEVEDWMTP